MLFSLSREEKAPENSFDKLNNMSEFLLKILGLVFLLLTCETEIVFGAISLFAVSYKFLLTVYFLCMIFALFSFLLSRSIDCIGSDKHGESAADILLKKKSFFNTLGVICLSDGMMLFMFMALLYLQ
ncbi:MAG: hypothetical protein IJI14_20900 [Anaerolineaceae bacterium]|nr:hypothetical protein [Anaerolineaceae bacterium]